MSQSSEKPRAEAAALIGVLVLALVARLVFARGLYAFDDFNYLRHAAEVWQLRFDLDQVLYWHGMRTFIFVPIALVFAIFGVSEATATAWPLVASLLLVALTYRLGLLLGGRRVGLLGALALAILPMAVDESTKVMPGVFIGLLTTASAYAFVHAERARSHRAVWLAASGVLYAGMPWAGHLGLVFGVFFPLALLVYRRHPLRSYWPLAAGVVGVMALAVVLQLAVARDPALNLNVSRTVLETETPTPKPFFYTRLMLRPLEAHGGVFFLSALGGLVALLGVEAAFGRDVGGGSRGADDDRRMHARGALLALLWFLATYVVIEFGSTSLTSYRPMFKQARYLSMLAVPGALLAGVGAAWLLRAVTAWRSRAVGVGVVAVLLLLVGAGSWETLRGETAAFEARRAPLERLAEQVRAYAGQTIYVTHWLWNTRVGFFMRYAEPYRTSGYAPYQSVRLETANPGSKNRYVQTIAPGEELEGGLLINDEQLLRSSIGPSETRMVREGEIPAWLAEVPAEWRLVSRVGEVAMYEVPRGWKWPGPDGVAREK